MQIFNDIHAGSNLAVVCALDREYLKQVLGNIYGPLTFNRLRAIVSDADIKHVDLTGFYYCDD
jgi:hypothetical protein